MLIKIELKLLFQALHQKKQLEKLKLLQHHKERSHTTQY
jgi:hypothetical protein